MIMSDSGCQPGLANHQLRTVVTSDSDSITLSSNETGGLGEIQILHPPGTFALTPASLISLQAIGENQELLTGNGLDWGSGTGCLTIAAAKTAGVKAVLGLEVSEANVEVAPKNARQNGVEDKVAFILADSYSPLTSVGRGTLDALAGQVDFILANPPTSEGDDGFEYRRIVLDGARRFLVDGGLVFLSISYQYGLLRIEHLSGEVSGYAHGGVPATTDWVPFDLGRPDLLHCLELYALEERRGGLEYTFPNPRGSDHESINAQAALAHFRTTGQSPLTRWQTHLFRYTH